MSDQADQTQNAIAAAEAPKRGRPPKEAASEGKGDFVSQLRSLAASHRGRVAKLVAEERRLEERLLAVRRNREAAEAPLREVEATLARFPELALEAEQEAAQ